MDDTSAGARYCPKCGEEVSKDSIACPHCAAPLPRQKDLEGPPPEELADGDVGYAPQPSDLMQASPADLAAPPKPESATHPPAPPPPVPIPPPQPPQKAAHGSGWLVEGDDEKPSMPLSPAAGAGAGVPPPPGMPPAPPAYDDARQPMPIYAPPTARIPATPAMENVGFWPRVGAALIDVLIISMLTTLLAFVTVVVANISELDDDTIRGGAQIIANVTAAFTILAYYTLMNGAYGATLGKMALGMKIVREDGSPISYGIALGRIVLKQILGACTCALFYISVATNEEYRGWHDQIVGTRVIYNR